MAVVPSLEDLSIEIIRLNSHKIFSLKLDNLLTPLYYADKVLNSICAEDEGISEDYLQYFKKERCLLQNVMINCSKIHDFSTMSFLKGHLLTNLELMHIEDGSVRQCLEYVEPNDLSNLTLTKVNFYGAIQQDDNMNIVMDVDWIGRFNGVTTLNISFSDFDDEYFLVVCKECKNLENLNISATEVTRLEYMENLKYLKYINCSAMSKTLVLNIPESNMIEAMVMLNNESCDLDPILNRTYLSLRILVLATCYVVKSEKFKSFVDRHNRLECLGFVQGHEDFPFMNPESPEYRPKISILGVNDFVQQLNTLATFKECLIFEPNFFNYMEQELNENYDSIDKTCLLKILNILLEDITYLRLVNVSINGDNAIFSCIHKIICHLGPSISKSLMRNIVNKCIKNMIINTDSFLCILEDNIHLLSEKYHLCFIKFILHLPEIKLSKRNFFESEEFKMGCQRVSDIFADFCKIFNEKTLLGNEIIEIVEDVQTIFSSFEGSSGILNIFKDMLNLHQPYNEHSRITEILWKMELLFQNLLRITVDSPKIADNFLRKNIRNILLEILKVLHGRINFLSLVGNVLGILYNALVYSNSWWELINDAELLFYIAETLKSNKVSISHAAGGILSHVLVLRNLNRDRRLPSEFSYNKYEYLLLRNIEFWTSDIKVFVSYKNFDCLLPLLDSDVKAAKLWALWTIRYFCKDNSKIYVPLAKKAGIIDKLKKDMNEKSTNHDVFSLIIDILEIR
ncbi:DgyrCDS5266 [Dimorphilus gyrociliatus]|uniref:DgyrCDS5266 n=1 Tax=Dimorphilus gyrociliatus TaxID=2664684 RepID=A0A7I8VM22_9ANNE|nr:DgyrCDS5266 [Dimorphilus gyrociliatus]